MRYGLHWLKWNYISAEKQSSSASWETIVDSAWLLVFSHSVPSLHFLSLNLLLPPNRAIAYLSLLFHCSFTLESGEHGLWR